MVTEEEVTDFNEGFEQGVEDRKNGINGAFVALLEKEPERKKDFDEQYINGYLQGYNGK